MTGRFPHLPAVVLVALLVGCASEGESISASQAELTVCAPGPTLAGIDVSHYQGTIDWDAVKGAGISYAFIRVSDGTGTMDKQFARNWAEAKRVGIKRGAYQFFRPKQDPNAQADVFLKTMGALDADDLPAVIDVEAADGVGPAQIAANIGAWIQRVEAATGKKPIIYTGLYFWRDSVGNTDAFRDYPLWVAQYGRQCPDIPSSWGTWALWQTGSTGRVAGIAGNVDTDLFNGDMGALMAMAGGMAECGDGYCNGGETGATCEQDCPVCKPVTTVESRVIDNGDVCQELGGNPTYWREEQAGFGGSLRWTYTTDSPAVSNYCAWHLEFNAAGKYRVEVHLPQPFAQSKQTSYEIGHNGAVEARPVDQSAGNGWVSLGEYDFAMGANQYVLVGDNTGESRDMNRQLVCDALRVTSTDLPPDGGDGNMEPPRGTPTDGYMGGSGASGSSCAVSRTPGHAASLLWPLGLALGVVVARRRRR